MLKVLLKFQIVIIILVINYLTLIKCNKGDLMSLQTWDDYKLIYNKSYPFEYREERSKRAFEENINKIQNHNMEYNQGMHSFKIGTNILADLSNQLYLKEYVRLTSSMHRKLPTEDEERVGSIAVDESAMPEELDWRTQGFLTPANNQKSCGSCYAFSIAHSVMGQIFKRLGRLVMLSEQQIVDCSVTFGNHGCAGGSLRNTLKYLEQSGGLMRQEDYPYTSSQNKCKFLQCLSVVNITSWSILPPHDQLALKAAIFSIGPIAVSINASPTTFQLYSEGVYDDQACSSDTVNHAMLAVGYTKHYWILKNWWGEKWGEKGYMKLNRTNNLCGVTNFAAYAIV